MSDTRTSSSSRKGASEGNRTLARILNIMGLRSGSLPKAKHMTYRRTGWWGKLSDLADRKAFNWKTREALYAHIAAQVENGVAIETALDDFSESLGELGRKSAQTLVDNVSRRMREGMPLRKAIEVAVPREEVALIAGGEQSGKLAHALEVLIETHDRVEAVVRAYKSAVARPVQSLAMVYGLLWVVGGYVIPNLVQGLPEKDVHGVGLMMYEGAEFSHSLWSAIPPLLIVAVILLVRWSMPRWTGSSRIVAERFFPYSFYRDIEGYKWLSSFAGMIEAGIPDVHILARQMETANPWLKERLRHVRFRMTEGGLNLAEALKAKGPGKLPPFNFPNPQIIFRIRSIVALKDFHEKVSRVAKKWSVEIERDALAQAMKFGRYSEYTTYALMGFLLYAFNEVTKQLTTIGGVSGM